jgi:DNA-binding NarL/FixJ family response regulator
MDLAMPRLNGIEATLRIRRQWPSCRVLILTQYDRKEYVQRMLQAGASGYVLKKAGGAEVATAIRAVRNGHVYLGAEVADLVIEDYVEHLGRLDVRGQSAFGHLTDRQREVLVLVAEGHTTREIAEVLTVSTKTVDAHRAAIARKLGLRSQADLTSTPSARADRDERALLRCRPALAQGGTRRPVASAAYGPDHFGQDLCS